MFSFFKSASEPRIDLCILGFAQSHMDYSDFITDIEGFVHLPHLMRVYYKISHMRRCRLANFLTNVRCKSLSKVLRVRSMVQLAYR